METRESPPKNFCESHEHEMYWWAIESGQYEVCAKCAFATTYPGRKPVETEWSPVTDQSGARLPHLDHWMPR